MRLRLVLCLASVLGCVACSDDSTPKADAAPVDGPVDAAQDAHIDAHPVPDADIGPDAMILTTCATMHAGWNENYMVDALYRSFYLDLPSDATTASNLPVIFLWHGLGDTAENMRLLLSGQVNTAGFHFILVTPEDGEYTVYGNDIDWDVLNADALTNREARLFDEVLTCLVTHYSLDLDRVHSVGFSMGGILTDMLGDIRGADLASLLTFSGGYLSDGANVATLGALASFISWPAPNHTNGYVQVLLSGGTTDAYALGGIATAHFDTFATNDLTYLNDLGHDVIKCDHGEGHTAPVTGFGGTQVVEFLQDHPRGVVNSPYVLDGLPADFPSYCSVSAQTVP